MIKGKRRVAPKDPGPLENVFPKSFGEAISPSLDSCERAVDQLADWGADRCNHRVVNWQNETREINKRNRCFDGKEKKLAVFCNLTVKSVVSGADRRLKIQAYVRDPRTYKRTGKMFEIPKTKPSNSTVEPQYNLRVINYQLRNTPELVEMFHQAANLARVVASMSRRINAVRRLINLMDRDRARLLDLPVPYLTDRPKRPEGPVATPEIPTQPKIRDARWEDYADPKDGLINPS